MEKESKTMDYLEAITRLDDIVKRFKNEKQLLVYGAGQNARIFYDRIKGTACQLIFFDRRAETEEFFFDGCRVRPSRDMLDYPHVPVLVTPFFLRTKL